MHEAAPSSPSGLVFSIQRFSIHDGPGIRTTVFLKGCPADCWWCHNPEARGAVTSTPAEVGSCAHCGEPILSNEAGAVCGLCGHSMIGRRMAPEAVAAAVARDEVFYGETGGGVTFSGGEPLAQPDFLLACLEATRALGLHRTVDTSGSASEATVLAVAERTDLFLYDLKLMDEVRHKRFVGISNGRIRSNLRALARVGADVWIRVPLIPGVNDDRANLSALAEFIFTLERSYPVFLLPYHRIGADKYRRLGEAYRLEGLEPPGRGRLQEIAGYLRDLHLEVRIGQSVSRPTKARAGDQEGLR